MNDNLRIILAHEHFPMEIDVILMSMKLNGDLMHEDFH